jgi:glycosyltransferase involved in cell wall biosynthesis
VAVLAVIHTYNEADVIAETVGHLCEQGVDVLIIDDWSTDATFDVATRLADESGGRVRADRAPDRRQDQAWFEQLRSTERVSRESDAYDWILHHDADEWRMSPWAGVGLRDAIAFVDALGYNALDHTVVDFRYLADGGGPSGPSGAMERLQHFEFGKRPGHFSQVKAWRRRDAGEVGIAASGGHEATFPGRRIFPLKFLMRHYPLRNPDQARRKIFDDRLPRQRAEKVERGWHVHYDRLAEDRRVVDGWQPDELLPWSEPMFRQEFLVERLSGIGIMGD